MLKNRVKRFQKSGQIMVICSTLWGVKKKIPLLTSENSFFKHTRVSISSLGCGRFRKDAVNHKENKLNPRNLNIKWGYATEIH